MEEVSAFRPVIRNFIPADGPAEPVSVAEMTASGFRVARVPPLLGRTLLDADEEPGAAPVVVIGRAFWETRFGGDPDVVGRTVQLGREEHTIVGVMPEGFRFPLAEQLWVPLRWDADEHLPLTDTRASYAFGRLAPGW